MTQEEKFLLLQDLCARLPYGVKVQPSGSASPHRFVGYDKSLVRIDTDQRFELENIKPYLRTMSSMTEEEKEELNNYIFSEKGLRYFWFDDGIIYSGPDNQCFIGLGNDTIDKMIEWLNKHHFDYRGLIERGLALEAPEGMYKTWNSLRGNLKEDNQGNIVGGLKL